MLEGEEHGLNIGVGLADVAHTVVFLVATGEFVLLDDAVHIVVHVGAEHDAVLPVELAVGVAHGLGIEVVVLLFVLHEPAVLLEEAELACAFAVATLVVLGALGLEVDFGFDDMVERLFVLAGLGTSLVTFENIVGTAFHLLYKVLRGRTPRKGFTLGIILN